MLVRWRFQHHQDPPKQHQQQPHQPHQQPQPHQQQQQTSTEPHPAPPSELPPEKHPHHFQIFYQAVQDKSPTVKFASSEQRSVLLDRLVPETEYLVVVFASGWPLRPAVSPAGNASSATSGGEEAARAGSSSVPPALQDATRTRHAPHFNRTEDDVGSQLPVGLVRFVAPGSANDSSSAGSGSASGPTRSLSAAAPSSSRPVVRDEEIVIVVLVLMVWVAVILLFFNKWGKIRMLEPYQPQYQREPQFSTSSSLGPPPVLLKTTGAVERELRRLSSVASNYYVGGVAATGASRLHRVRQNSVFVGSQILVAPLPRRYKSAEDIKSMVVQIEHQASTQSTAL